MILEIPYVYRADVLLARARKPSGHNVLGTVAVRLKHATPEEAPVVARATWRKHHPWPSARVREPVSFDYRVVDGALLRRLRLPIGGHGSHACSGFVDVQGDGAQAALNDWAAGIIQSGFNSGMWGNPFLPRSDVWLNIARRDQMAVRRWIWSDAEERAGEIRRAAAEARVIDGAIYVPSHGPGWVVRANTTVDWAANAEVRGSYVQAWHEYGHLDNGPLAGESVFSAENLDSARAEAVRLAAEHGQRFGGQVGEIEIVDRALMLSAVNHHHALRAAAAKLAADVLPDLAALPPDAIIAFAEVKRALAAPVTDDDIGFEALLMSVRDLNEAACAHRGTQPYGTGNHVGRLIGRFQASQILDVATPDAAAPAPAR